MEKLKIEPLKKLKKGVTYWQVFRCNGLIKSEPDQYTALEDKTIGESNTPFFSFFYFFSEPHALAWIDQQLNPEPEQWKPENGEKYYFYGWLDKGEWRWEVFDAIWRDDLSCCQERLAQGNVHRRKEDCEAWSKKEYKEGEPQEGDKVHGGATIGAGWEFYTNAEYLQYLAEQEQKPTDQDVPRDKNGKELKAGDKVKWLSTSKVVCIFSFIKNKDLGWCFELENDDCSYACYNCELIEPQEKGLREYRNDFLEQFAKDFSKEKTQQLHADLTWFIAYVEIQKGEKDA